MESVGVLMVGSPVNPYMEEKLVQRFKLYNLHSVDNKSEFLETHKNSIRAIVSHPGCKPDAQLLESLPKLEIIANHGVGFDNIDLSICRKRAIRVTNTPDILTDDVADLAIGLMLAVLRKICQGDRFVRRGSWNQGNVDLGSKFSGKRVGIIGLGRIGMAIAKRAEAFGCPTSYYSRSEKAELGFKYHPSATILATNCDILVVACSLTQQTRHIVNRQVIDSLGASGVLINVGRGLHVDEAELVSALVDGRLGGAGLDVFEDEPNVPEELLRLENVVVLPHVGTASVETRIAMANLVVENLIAHFSSKPLLSPVI